MQQTPNLPQKNLRKTGQRVDLPLQDTQWDWGAPKVARRVAKTIRRHAMTRTRTTRAADRHAGTPLAKNITQGIAIRAVSMREKEAREARVAKDVAKEAAIASSNLQCRNTPRVTTPVVLCGTYHAAVTNIVDWSTGHLLTTPP